MALQAAPDDYSNLKERQAFYVVSVPGETAWVKEVRFVLLSSALALDSPHVVEQNLDKTTAECEPRPSALFRPPLTTYYTALEASVAALSLSNAEPTAEPTLLANKYPVPSEPHFGCIVKVSSDHRIGHNAP